jgi:hypothetical protein
LTFDEFYQNSPYITQIPSWNELVIYEIYIETLNAKEGKEVGGSHSAIEKFGP